MRRDWVTFQICVFFLLRRAHLKGVNRAFFTVLGQISKLVKAERGVFANKTDDGLKLVRISPLRCCHTERSTAPCFLGDSNLLFLPPVSHCLPSRVVCFWQNGPLRRRRPGLVELRGWRVRAQPEPRRGGRVHRWHLPSLQADQSAACPHHGLVQPHPSQGKLLHRQQVPLHLWRGQRGQEVRQENHWVAISFFCFMKQKRRVRCEP